MKIDYETVTLEELLSLDYQDTTDTFNSVIIVPLDGELHESGYRKMKFILVKKDGTVAGVVGGGSDVLHLNGIGGYGKGSMITNYAWKYGKVNVIDWCIDCLPVCKCLRLFSSKKLEVEGLVMSDAQIVVSDKQDK